MKKYMVLGLVISFFSMGFVKADKTADLIKAIEGLEAQVKASTDAVEGLIKKVETAQGKLATAKDEAAILQALKPTAVTADTVFGYDKLQDMYEDED